MFCERNDVTSAVEEGYDDLVRLWSVAGPFFAEELAGDGKEYKRRPSLSVRIPVVGEPDARLLIAPGWDPIRKAVQSGILVLDLTVERVPGVHATEVAFSFDGAIPRVGRYSCRWGVESAGRVRGAIREFLAEPGKTFSRSAINCCICRRGLIDPISRGRGIGPECLSRANRFRERIERLFADHGVSREAEERMLREARERAEAARAEDAARWARYRSPVAASDPAEADAQPMLFS